MSPNARAPHLRRAEGEYFTSFVLEICASRVEFSPRASAGTRFGDGACSSAIFAPETTRIIASPRRTSGHVLPFTSGIFGSLLGGVGTGSALTASTFPGSRSAIDAGPDSPIISPTGFQDCRVLLIFPFNHAGGPAVQACVAGVCSRNPGRRARSRRETDKIVPPACGFDSRASQGAQALCVRSGRRVDTPRRTRRKPAVALSARFSKEGPPDAMEPCERPLI